MFVMLSSFNLKPDVATVEFQLAKDKFCEHMHQQGFVHSVGPLGERVSNTPMDTDNERPLQFYFLSYFQDRTQCDQAYELIEQAVEPSVSIHRAMIAKVRDAVVTCWDELEPTK